MAHIMEACDIQAVAILQSAWIKATKTSAVYKILHVIRYLRDREEYQRSRDKRIDLATIRKRRAREAVSKGQVINL